MLEIETAITAIGPEAQRRVLDWIRARWLNEGASEGVHPAQPLDLDGLTLDDIVSAHRHGVDPSVLTMPFRTAPPGQFDVFEHQFQEDAGGVLSAEEGVDEATAMLDEADWASGLLSRLTSPNPSTLVCALQELKQPGVEERLRNITSRETVNKAYADAVRRYPDGKADKAHSVGGL